MMRRYELSCFLSAILTATSALAAGPRLLAPGAISTEDHEEYGLALSPDGEWAYFTRGSDVYRSRRCDGEWTPATPAPFNSDAFDGDPFITPDGRRLLFMSARDGSALDGADREARPRADVWLADRRTDGSWGPPVNAGRGVNTPAAEGHASATADGTLYYFSGHEGGLGGHDIYRSVRTGDGYGKGENLGPPVSSEHGDGHPYVSPDESYLVFYSKRPGGHGSCDLYISFRQGERWSEPRNLGPEINSADCDMTPHVSPDGSRLYFARIHQDGGRDLYVADFSADRWRTDGDGGSERRRYTGSSKDFQLRRPTPAVRSATAAQP